MTTEQISKWKHGEPFIAPAFDPGRNTPKVSFVWWSWHPKYPYWSKSCWGGETEDMAWEAMSHPSAIKLRYYHNKLIREGDGKFTEVADYPPQTS